MGNWPSIVTTQSARAEDQPTRTCTEQPIIATSPQRSEVAAGSNVTFTVETLPGEGRQYSWEWNSSLDVWSISTSEKKQIKGKAAKDTLQGNFYKLTKQITHPQNLAAALYAEHIVTDRARRDANNHHKDVEDRNQLLLQELMRSVEAKPEQLDTIFAIFKQAGIGLVDSIKDEFHRQFNMSLKVAEGWKSLSANERFHGVDSATLTIREAHRSDEGRYRCAITRDDGTELQSQPATLKMADPPSIITHPQSVENMCVGGEVTFIVEANGASPITYTWEKKDEAREEWQPISLSNKFQAADSPTLTVSDVQLSDQGSYRCVVCNCAGSNISLPATLTLDVPPTITTQPQDVQDAIPEKAAVFAVEATGSGSLTFTWERCTGEGESWEALLPTDHFQGTNTPTITISGVEKSDEGRYRCTISNKNGSVISQSASLTLVDVGSVISELERKCSDEGVSPEQKAEITMEFVETYGEGSEIARKALMALVKMDTEQLDAVKAFLHKSVPVEFEEDGWSPLQQACVKGHSHIAWEFLTRGGDKHRTTEDGRTLLHLAVEKGNSVTVNAIIWNEGDVNALDKRKRTPLHAACESTKTLAFDYEKWRHVLEIVENLVKVGAKVDAQDEVQRTPLHYASSAGFVKMVEILLKHGVKSISLYLKDKEQCTPLHLASLEGHTEAVRTILDSDTQARSLTNMRNKDGNTPLHLACCNGHCAVAKALLNKGANVTVVNDDGDTALHLACSKGHRTIAEVLLQKKADSTTQNKDGRTPAMLAIANNHLDLLTLKGLTSPKDHATLRHMRSTLDAKMSAQTPPIRRETFANRFFGIPQRGVYNTPGASRPKVKVSKENSLKSQAAARALQTCFTTVTESMDPRKVAGVLFKKGVIDSDTLRPRASSSREDRRAHSHELVLELIRRAGSNSRPVQFELICTVFESGSVDGVQKLREEYHKQTKILKVEDACNDGDCNSVKDIIAQCGPDSEVARRAVMFVAGMEMEDIGIKLLNSLLQCGVPPDFAEEGWRPVQEACAKGNFKILRTLLAEGADKSMRTHDGQTLLHLAAENAHSNVVVILLCEEANIHAQDDKKRTPLHSACEAATEVPSLPGTPVSDCSEQNQITMQLLHQRQRELLSIMENLLKYGAKSDTQDKVGNTPLHVACSTGNKEVVDLLLKYDVECKAAKLRNNQLQTPLEIAIRSNFEDIAKSLQEHVGECAAGQQSERQSTIRKLKRLIDRK